MNSFKSAVLVAVVLVVGVGLRIGVFSGPRSPQNPSAETSSPQASSPLSETSLGPSKPSSTPRLVEKPRNLQSPPTARPAATALVSSRVAAPVAAPAAPEVVAFEALTPCDQLDAIAKAGKSVAEFLVAAHRVNDLAKYDVAIESTCPWNAEQLQLADRLINPPVVVVRTNVVERSHGSANSGSRGSSGERPSAWNNCNGIQEPGESYSAACDAAQQENDEILRHGFMKPLNPIDNRPPWRQPSFEQPDPPYARGYSAN